MAAHPPSDRPTPRFAAPDDGPRTDSDLRHRNAAAIVRLLAEHGPMARTELAAALAMSTGSVTRITADLVDAGIVREMNPLVSNNAGRRRVPVQLDDEHLAAVGLHVGLREITYGLVNLHGQLIGDWYRQDRQSPTAKATIAQARGLGLDLASQYPQLTMLGFGLIAGGIVRHHNRCLATSSWDGWTDAHDLELSSLGVPTSPTMTFDNAYGAAARAEMWFGGATHLDNFITVFGGTAIGMAIVVDRKVLEGHQTPAARIEHQAVTGTVGQPCQCGRPVCLKAVAGPVALVQRARAAGITEARDLQTIDELSRSGNPRAAAIVADRLDALSQVVATTIDLLAPQKVFLSGGYLTSAARVATMRQAIGKHAGRSVDDLVVASSLGNFRQATVISAAAPVLEQFFLQPLATVES